MRDEAAWIQSYGRPRTNHYRSRENAEFPGGGFALLAQYMTVAPYLVPSTTDEAVTSRLLWHPDLHIDNVFVDPDTCDTTRVVDWQSSYVAPLFYQSDVPKMFDILDLFEMAGLYQNDWRISILSAKRRKRRLMLIWRVRPYIITKGLLAEIITSSWTSPLGWLKMRQRGNYMQDSGHIRKTSRNSSNENIATLQKHMVMTMNLHYRPFSSLRLCNMNGP